MDAVVGPGFSCMSPASSIARMKSVGFVRALLFVPGMLCRLQLMKAAHAGSR